LDRQPVWTEIALGVSNVMMMFQVNAETSSQILVGMECCAIAWAEVIGFHVRVIVTCKRTSFGEIIFIVKFRVVRLEKVCKYLWCMLKIHINLNCFCGDCNQQ